MKLRHLAVAGIAVAIVSTAAYAGGLFQNLPVLGYAASQLCSLYAGDGVTCVEQTPAGPATFNGSELVPADTLLGSGNQPQTIRLPIEVLGNGPMTDVTSVGTSQTIPANTPWYFLDGAQGSALTVTMPAAPTEGYIQRVVCEAATVGTLTVAANTNQTLKGNPNAACVAGVGYAWRYQASNTTWYRFQ